MGLPASPRGLDIVSGSRSYRNTVREVRYTCSRSFPMPVPQSGESHRCILHGRDFLAPKELRFRSLLLTGALPRERLASPPGGKPAWRSSSSRSSRPLLARRTHRFPQTTRTCICTGTSAASVRPEMPPRQQHRVLMRALQASGQSGFCCVGARGLPQTAVSTLLHSASSRPLWRTQTAPVVYRQREVLTTWRLGAFHGVSVSTLGSRTFGVGTFLYVCLQSRRRSSLSAPTRQRLRACPPCHETEADHNPALQAPQGEARLHGKLLLRMAKDKPAVAADSALASRGVAHGDLRAETVYRSMRSDHDLQSCGDTVLAKLTGLKLRTHQGT